MELKDFLIGLLVFSMMSMAITGVLVDMNYYYGAGINTTKFGSYDEDFSNLTGTAEDFRKDIQESGSDVAVTSQWDTSSIGTLTGIKALIFNSVPTAYKIFQTVIQDLGLPGWFWAGAFAILVISVGAIIANAIFRYNM